MDTTKIADDGTQTESEETASTANTPAAETDPDTSTRTDTDTGTTGSVEATEETTAGTDEVQAVADTESADTESADTDSADTDSADTDSADTDSADTDSADTDSADTESADTDSADTSKGGVLSGATSVVAAAVGLVSLSGSWLGTQIADRQQLVGQIKTQGGATGDPIADIYATPWHTTALVNGTFALVAIVLGAVVLMFPQVDARVPGTRWIRAVATGALVLGVLGVLIAVAMRSDLFTPLPPLPTRSAG